MEAFIGSIWFACFTFVAGYVLGNVYVISWRANRLKSSATIDELEKIIGYIKERQNETV